MCAKLNGELEYNPRPQQQKLFEDQRPGVYRPVFGSSPIQQVQEGLQNPVDVSLMDSLLPGSVWHHIALAG